MLQLLLGRNQGAITEAILSRAAWPAAGERSLVIVPEQYSHVIERKLCQLGGDAVSARSEVLTFSRLAQRVFQELGGSARPVLDKGGRLLLMHLATARLAGELKIYRQAREKAGFLTSLLATADECKSYCISPELLLEAGAQAEEEGQRLRELGLILSAYDALVADRAEDPRDRLTRLAQTLRGTDYFLGRAVYLDGFTDFTPQERLVLEVLLRQAPSVTVGLRCDTLQLNGEDIFAPTRRTALALVSLARENGVGMEYACLPQPEGEVSALSHLEHNLFSGETTALHHVDEMMFCCKANDPYIEIEQAAEEILCLVRDKGYHFRDITVAARTLEGWGERMESVFGRYHIPIFLSRMDDILQKPVLALLTSALDTVAGGYEYEDIFRYLKTGLTDISLEDRDLLENYVLQWDIRGTRWTSDKNWSWHPRGYGQEWSDQDREYLTRLDALRRKVVEPLEHLRQTKAQTGRDWAQAVYDFLEEIELPACLTRRAEELTGAGELREAEEYRQVWQILIGALEQCSDLLGEDPMKLGDFADLFQLVLSQYQVGTIPVSLDRVTCSDMARISHATGRVLFLLGADDENLPMVGSERCLLTDQDRALLSQFGVETALDQDGRMDREMLLIYECCTMPTDRLYVSYAAHGLDGGEKRPSFLIHRLLELFPELAEQIQETHTEALPSALAPALEAAAAQGDQQLLGDLAELEGADVARRALVAADQRRENLSPQAVQELYRDTIRLSASRMDKVKSCHYAYFLQYGLKAKPRKPAGLDAPEAGTFVHYVLEHVLSTARTQGGVSSLDKATVKELADQATRQYIREKLGGMEDKTPRFRYLFRRLAQSAVQVVEQMVEELQASDFEPIAFELGFGPKEELPPVRLQVDGITVAISGFVDRVDGWVHDGRLYVRVMDYKTGHKSFDLTDVWHGLNLQMLLYLFTLEEKGLPGEDRPIVPAGVLYLPAREEHLTGSRNMDPEKRQKELDSKLRRSGLILNDPNVIDAMEHVPLGSDARFLPVRISKRTGAISGDALASAVQLGKLQKHIHRILRDIAREIGGGNIQADPWYRDEQRTACRWCDYASACHFEDGRGGERSRYLYPVKGTEFWEQVDEELQETEEEGGF